MKKYFAICAALICSNVFADESKSDNELDFNISITTDYRYRGISQTRLKPALQGGADYTHHPTGLYLGTWLSTIKWIKDDGGNDNIEWDLYGGKRGEIIKDVSYDVGVLSYVYPSNNLTPNANTTEIYGQLGYGPGYLKYLYSLTNLFGFTNSKRSGYLDAGANFNLAWNTTLNLHVGHQWINNNSIAGYTDWKVALTKDFAIAAISLAFIGSNANKKEYASPANGKFLGRNGVVASISKVF